MRMKFALAVTTALGALTYAGLQASAQQSAAPPPPPAQQAPAERPAGPPPGAPGAGPQGEGRGMREGRGKHEGMHEGMHGGRGDRMANMSEQDRAAFMAARLAGMKAGLLLTPEQERLWPPVEKAFRDMAKMHQDWRERVQKEGRSASPVDGMRRMGEMMSARGDAMKRMAEAADPLYKTLTDDQKRRLRMLGPRMGGMGMGGMGMDHGMDHDMGERGGMRGRHHDHEGRDGRGRHGEDGGGRGWRQGGVEGGAQRLRQSSDWLTQGFDRGGRDADWRNL